MKCFILLFLLVNVATAAELGFFLVKQPLYIVDAGYEPITIVNVPYMTMGSDPERRFSGIATPFVPAHDSSWRKPRDLNLVSAYGIKIFGTYNYENENSEPDGYKVKIDCTNAKRPDAFHELTIHEVVAATKDCIRQMCPELKDEKFKLVIEVIGLKEEGEPEAR